MKSWIHAGFLVVLGLVALLLAGCGNDHQPVYTGAVAGTVTDMDTNVPVAGVTVELLDNGFTPYTGDDPSLYAGNQAGIVATAVSDADGTYRLANVPPGNYTVAPLASAGQSVITSTGDTSVVVTVGQDTVTADFLSGQLLAAPLDKSTYTISLAVKNLPESWTGGAGVVLYRRFWYLFIPIYPVIGLDDWVKTVESYPGSGGWEINVGDGAYVVKDTDHPAQIGFTVASTSFLYDNHYYIGIEYNDPKDGTPKEIKSPVFSAGSSSAALRSFFYDVKTNKVSTAFPVTLGYSQTFTYSSSFGAAGIFTLNGDQTWSATIDGVEYGGIWNMDNGVDLVCQTTTGGNFTETYTFNSATDTTITASRAETDPTHPNYVVKDTATFTRIFSVPMVAGRTYAYKGSSAGSKGVLTLKADMSWSQTNDSGTYGGTWSVDDQGQLVTTGANFTATYALSKNIWNVIDAAVTTQSPMQGTAKETLTLSEAFSSELVAGKTFRYSGPNNPPLGPGLAVLNQWTTSGNITFASEGTWTTAAGGSGYWSIDAKGQLCIADSSSSDCYAMQVQQNNAIEALDGSEDSDAVPGTMDFIPESSN